MQEHVFLDEIVSIEEVGEMDTIDITVSGNNLFFANGILTHNSGYGSSDVSMTDTSESFGLNFTADLAIAAISSEELEKLNQMMFKQLKNRYNDPNYYNKFVVGIDRSRMRLFDCETRASNELVSNRTEEVTASIFQDLTKGSKNFSKLKV